MAELIEQIVSSEALAQVKELKNELGQTLEKFTANVNSAKILNSVLARAEGMQATNDALKKQSATLDEVEKLKKQLVTTNQKLVASETVYNQLLLEEKQRLNEANAETRRHIKEKNAEIGSYNQLEAQLSKMSKQYKAMGEAQRNSASGKDFLNNLQKTEMQLKSLDATMGSHKRNVGNYQNQLFGLTQVFREIPAFTYSAQTGILGLSNNLPILADNFSNVAKATNEVTGKVNGTTGALKIFASSIFSFGNVFAIAIGLFTIFSKEIFAFIKGTENATNALDEYKKETYLVVDAQTSLNKAMASAQYQEAIKNVEQLKISLQLAKEGFVSKESVVKMYNDTLGETIGKVKTIDEVETELVNNGQKYIEMMLYKAAALLSLEEASKKYLEAELRRRKGEQDIANDLKENESGDAPASISKSFQSLKNTFKYGLGSDADNLRKQTKDEVKGIKKEGDVFKNISLEFQKNAQQIQATFRGNTSKGGINKVGKSGKVETTKKDNKEIEDLSKDHAKILMDLDFKIAEYNRETDEATKQRILKGLDDQLKAKQKADAEELELIRTNLEAQDKMLDDAEKDDEDRMRRKMEKLHAIYEIQMGLSELALNVSDAIAQKDLQDLDNKEKKQQEYFEAELKRIEESSALGINKEKEKARVEAENNAKKKQFERERIDIQRRQAKFQKAADVSSVISATAIAVMSALGARPYTPANIALSIGAGLAGAAQLAKVIGTPLPQYFAGTEDHKGGLAIVGDKYGKEIIVEPSGKTYFTPDTDTLVNLPAHSKVIPNKDISDYLMNNKIGFAPHYIENKLEFEDVTNELKLLRKDLKGKNMSMSVINYGDFYGYIQKKIK